MGGPMGVYEVDAHPWIPRELTGIDYDEEKIAVANHCFSRDTNVHFVTKDINQLEVLPSDAIILSDTLHYILQKQ